MKRSSQLLELASKRSTEISELDFNKEKLITSLENVAHHLAKNRTEVTLIVVGGGLSTILLKTRASTPDVDFVLESYSLCEGNCLHWEHKHTLQIENQV